jgi:hypothetical protein
MNEQQGSQQPTARTKDVAPWTSAPAQFELDRDPAKALEIAKKAIDRLDQSTSASPEASRWAIGAVAGVCILAIIGVVVHTFYESEAPRVDGTTALLLAVLLFAPFIRHLRALEFGGAKAEFQDSASTGLSAVLVAVRADHDAISQIFTMITALTAPPESDETEAAPSKTGTTTAASTAPGKTVIARPLRRILWVDDNPEGNTYELNALRQLFDITTARTTEEAFAGLDPARVDAVISDIVRREGGELHYDAGARIAEHVATLNPPLPVFFYGSEGAAAIQAQQLTEAGAVVVTAEYVDLVRAIRRQARASFDASVRQALNQVPGRKRLVEQVEDLDFILELTDGRKVAIETPHWLRTPNTPTLQARYEKLSRAITSRKLVGALLVTQNNILTPAQRRQAPLGVEPLMLDELPARLAQL